MRGMLVVARYQEATHWHPEVPSDWPVVVVQKDMHLPNEGREPSSYFWFMATQEIDPGTTYAFIQGNPWPHGFEYSQLRAVNGYAQLGVHVLNEDHEGNPHHGGLPLVACLRDWMGVAVPPARFIFPAGAQFLVDGRTILSRPREWYAEMQRRVCQGSGPWIMERLWPHVWPHDTMRREGRRNHDLMGMIHGENVFAGVVPQEPDWQGWNSEAEVLTDVLARVDARLVVEVGSWKGASARTMGTWLRDRGGQLLCVDTWLGAREFIDDPIRRGWLQARLGFPQVYFVFLSNMVHAGLQRTVTPFPMASTTAARWVDHHEIRPDAVYVDASHDEEDVTADLRAWWRVLRPGGALFGDDYTEHWPGVVAAVERFAREGGHALELRPPHWIIAKP